MTIPARPMTMQKPAQTNAPAFKSSIKSGANRIAFKCGIYGPEGIGKSGLLNACPGIIAADLELSLQDYACKKEYGVTNWQTLRQWIQSLTSGIAGIDSITRAEDWAAEFVIKNKIGNDGSKAADSLEDFKYKAGLTFVADQMRLLFSDIDAAVRRGVSFVMIAHCRVNKFKNPDGSDFVRYEPRLINDEKQSIMLQWVQFVDHCVFIDLDKSVERGKVKGGGSRTIYLDTAANRICKSRGIDSTPLDYPEGDATLWKRLGVIK